MFNLKNKSNLTKKALTSILAFAIVTQCSASAVEAFAQELGTTTEKLKVAVLSDPHYFPKEYVTNTDNQEYKDYMAKELYLLAESAEIFEAALKIVAEDKPDFLLIPGDVTKNGELLGTEMVAEILNEFERLTGIDVFIVNGNHDVYDNAFAFNGPDGNKNYDIPVVTAQQYLSLYENFGYSDANEVHEIVYFGDNEGEVENTIHPEFSYVTRLKEGYVLLSLNSQLYSEAEDGEIKQSGGGFNEDLLSWAEEQIKAAEANGDTVIAMAHHGILPHSLASKLSEGSAIVNDWEDVATRLADAGLRYIFTGHMHENDIAQFTTPSGNTLYDIETGTTAGYGSPVRSVEFEKTTNKRDPEAEAKETVTVSSTSVKSTESIENLQEYMYDSIYKDSRYLEIKLTGALDSLIDSLANISLYELIYGTSTMSDVVKGAIGDNDNAMSIVGSLENKTLTEEEQAKLAQFNMAEKIGESFGEAVDGITIDTEDGQLTLDYDTEKNEIAMISSKSGIEDLLGSLDFDTFLKDVVKQLDEKVLNKEALSTEISKAITGILDIEVFETSEGEMKTLRDVINLFLIDHFLGAEDLSGWPEELLEQLKTGKGVAELIDNLIGELLNILPEALKLVEVNAKTLTNDFILQVGINAMLGKDKSLHNFLVNILKVDVVGLIKDPIDEYLNDYVTPSFERQMGVLLSNIIYELAGDDCQDDVIDGAPRVIVYEGAAVPQEPTVTNGLLPHSVAVTFGADETTEKAFSWYTGKNVPNNEIQIVKASDAIMKSNGEVDFTNAVTIEAESEIVKRSFPTLDLGLIAITKDKEVSRHQVVLSGLQSGTKYYYRVGSAEQNIYTDISTFETAEVNDNNFTFINFADTQAMLEDEYEIWQRVFGKAFEMYPEAKFVTHAGDMVDNGKNELQWQWFLNKPQEDLMATTFVPASGNHEEYGDFSHTDHFNIQDIPEQDLTTGAYYKVDYGNVLVMVINSNNLGEDSGLSEDQIQWIKDTATESDAKWKIIQIHKGTYTNGSHYADEDVVAMRAQLDPLVTELGIDFVLQGHDHTYARSEYLVNGEIEADLVKEERIKDGVKYETAINPEGTIYALTGSSAVKYYNPKETDLPLAFTPYVEDPIFAAIEIENDTLYYSAYTVHPETSEVSLLDTFAIEKAAVEADVTAPIITGVEDGGNYYVDRTVIASDDEALESVTINGVEVDGKYEIVAGYDEVEYTVVARDTSGNTTTVTFTMLGLPTADEIVYNDHSLSLISTIKAEFEAMKNTLYVERVQFYNNLLAALEEAYEIAGEVIADFIGKVEALPAPEDITAEDVREIRGVIAIYNTLTDDEKEALGEEVIAKIIALEEAIKVRSLATSDNKVTVTHTTQSGYFDIGTSLIAKRTEENGKIKIEAICDGIDVEVNGMLSVTIDLDGAVFGENNRLYLISKDGLTTTEINATVVDGKLVFETDNLGVFEIVTIATESEKEELVKLIQEANNIDITKYTAVTVKILSEAIENAENIVNKVNVTVAEVAEALEQLKEAIESLEEKVIIEAVVNKDELNELVNKLSSLDTSKYTNETVKSFRDAIENAKIVLENDEATQKEVNDALKALRNAVEGLIEKESSETTDSDEENNNSESTDNENTNSGSGNSGNSSSEKLPQTGGRNAFMTIAAGLLATIGGAMSMKKKK